MTVLRSRKIVPSPKTTPKSRKTTPNADADAMDNETIQPRTPNKTTEPSTSADPKPAPGTGSGTGQRRSHRLAHRSDAAEPVVRERSERVEALAMDGDGSRPAGARVSSLFEGLCEASEGEEIGVSGLNPGKRPMNWAESGEDVLESDSRKGKRKMASGSEEAGGGGHGRTSPEGLEWGTWNVIRQGSVSHAGGSGAGGSGGGAVGGGADDTESDNEMSEEGLDEELGGNDDGGGHIGVAMDEARDYMRRRFREVAMVRAARFARFTAEEEVVPDSGVDGEPDIGDWPGPFSTALKIIRDRERRSAAGFTNSAQGKPQDVEWLPKNGRDCDHPRASVPSLVELSLKGLLDNVDRVVSLNYVPDFLRKWMSNLLSDSRRLNGHVLRLLLQGSPMEVCIRDCSWLTEEELTQSFNHVDRSSLRVLQLDLCGRCLPDYIMLGTVARPPNNFPVLHTVSLRGACRLSDLGVNALVYSAPALTSLNLSQCSLLTYSSIETIASSLGKILRKLYLDECLGIDAMLMLPALKKFEQLEVLSLAGNESVCNEFIMEFVDARGHNMKELILTDCVKLTDSSVKVIAERCPGLCAIDLSKCKLTDSSLGYLANGCRFIQILRLCHSSFSDNGIAAFLETSGERLEELSLNNVKKAGCQTAMSIAKRLRKLHTLDLSWCRNLTDNAMGLIVDNCPSLRVLKLFGCTQITDLFLNGHSNRGLKIIGLKMSPVLDDFWKPKP